MTTEGKWLRDPAGVHHERWHDGERFTPRVRNSEGVEDLHRLPAHAPTTAPPERAPAPSGPAQPSDVGGILVAKSSYGDSLMIVVGIVACLGGLALLGAAVELISMSSAQDTDDRVLLLYQSFGSLVIAVFFGAVACGLAAIGHIRDHAERQTRLLAYMAEGNEPKAGAPWKS